MSKVAAIRTREIVYPSIFDDYTYIHEAMLRGFELLGYDLENPLATIIKPGDRVFIKPNFVADKYRESCPLVDNIYSIITHPSVIKATVDFAVKALKGKGEIVIGDCPSIDADFNNLMELTQLKALENMYDVPVRIYDLRDEWCDDLKNYGFKSKMKELPGDPEGSSILNLGKQSLFYGDNPLLFRGIYNKRWQTIRHHLFNKHEYKISNTMLNSDVFISIPKLKTHHKIGITVNVKGLVGINTDKNFLIHWKVGSPSLGGDEWYNPKGFQEYLLLILRHLLNDLLPERFYFWLRGKTNSKLFTTEESPCGQKHRGSGIKNETCWRMAADLYKLFVEQRKDKVRFFSIVDGILAGEGDGPFCAEAKPSGVLLMGKDFIDVDCLAAKIMNFNPHRIKYLRHYLKGNYNVDAAYYPDIFSLNFKVPSGWEELYE